ncbi:MAG: hypothetical protein ABW215_09270 [Kibdelosporangium sp.]
MKQPNNLRRAAIYGVAGLASAAIGVTAVSSLAAANSDQPEAQKTAQATSAPAAAPQAAPPAPTGVTPVAAAHPQVPTKLAVQTAPTQAAPTQAAPARQPAPKATPKPAPKPLVKAKAEKKPVVTRPAAKPATRKVAPNKVGPDKVAPNKTIAKKVVVRTVAGVQHRGHKTVHTAAKRSEALRTTADNARKALDQAGRDLASAQQNLNKAKAEVGNLRKQVADADKVRLPKLAGAPFGSVKVSPDLAKRLAQQRHDHVQNKHVKHVKTAAQAKN